MTNFDQDDAINGSDPEALKTCCAAAYQHDLVSAVLGESYHPGGLELTRRLGGALGLSSGMRVLDVASGTGASALLLAEEFGVRVEGIDLGETSVERANASADASGKAGARVGFRLGDAERLPFPPESFDALICECAFCTFPDKTAAAAEFARVLRPGGRVGLTDVTIDPSRLDPHLRTLAGYVACIADARPAAEYQRLLVAEGFHIVAAENHDEALTRMIEQIESRLRVLSLIGASGIDLDLDAVTDYTRAAARAVDEGIAGYYLLVGQLA